MGTEISNVKSIKSHQNYLTEFDVKSLSAELNGSIGRFRNPNMAYSLSRSNTDLEAINEWLNSVGSRSPQTRRSYEKEAFRLLMWAVAEHQKPISSLDIQDMLEYEVFVKSLVSKYEGVTWMAAKIIQKVDTSSDSRDVVDEVYLKKRYARTDSQWRPFDKPLTPDGIEYAMRVLKSMFSFWTDIGYTVVNPLKLRKVVKKQDKRKSKDRVMSTATWDFLYEHMQKKVASTARSNEGRKETIAHLKALQAFMVFNSLYLLGVRISELSSLRMNSIFRRESTKREDRYWVKVLGKGNKEREFPLPPDFIMALTRYRRVLNTLPVYHHNGLRDDLNPLPVWPTSTDSTSIVLALDRSSNLTPGAIHKIVKTVLSDVVMYLGNERLAGRDHESFNIDQLKQASAHWMRHTSATHQSLSGVSLRYIKDFLGHASFDTTLIYDHAVDEQWLSEISNFKLLTDSKKSCE